MEQSGMAAATDGSSSSTEYGRAAWTSSTQDESPAGQPLVAELTEFLRQHHVRLEQRLVLWMEEEERLLQGALAQHLFNPRKGGGEETPLSTCLDLGASEAQPSCGAGLARATSSEQLDCSSAEDNSIAALKGRDSVIRTPTQLVLEDEDRSRKEAAKSYSSEMRQALESKKDYVANSGFDSLGRVRQQLRTIVASPKFELFFGIAILSNAILIGVEVETTTSANWPEAPLAYRMLTHGYALVFLAEMLMRLGAGGKSYFTSEEWAWNFLDIFIVLCSVMEAVVDISQMFGGSAAKGRTSTMSNVRVFRIVRISRLVRITRISRLMRFIKALRTLVYSIICTLKSLVWALLLIGILIYVFGIFFAEITGDYLLDAEASDAEVALGVEGGVGRGQVDRYWGTLGRSMTTLFKAISGGVTWQDAVDPLGEVHWLVGAVFIMFIAFTQFAVLNVVTGVFCQSAIESAQRDQDMVMQAIIANKQHHASKLLRLFQSIDSGDSGVITFEDMERHMEDPRVQAYFTSLELDIDDAWTFFKLLDTNEGHAVQPEDFLLGCMRLRGNAKALDIAKLMHEQNTFVKRLTAFMLYVEKQFEQGSPAGQRRFSHCPRAAADGGQASLPCSETRLQI